jgi:simple sugar transport system permease protein
MASTTAASTLEREGGLRFKITRTGVFAVVFIVIGALILLDVPVRIGGDVTTLLTTDEGGTTGIPVPTVAFSVLVALSYIAGGVVALIPSPGLARLKWWWMVVNGMLLLPVVLVIVAAGGSTNITVMFRESLRLSTPIVLGALAGLWCERSGVTNIAIEGMMLTGACFGFVAFSLLGVRLDVGVSQWIGVLVAVLAGGVMAALHAWLSLKYRTNQIVSGTVINILAIGVTSFVRRDLLIEADATRQILAPFPLPGFSELPVVGPALFNGRPIFYSMFIVLIITHVVMYYTRWGLRTRAVGGEPPRGGYAGHQCAAEPLDQRHHRRLDRGVGGCLVHHRDDRGFR